MKRTYIFTLVGLVLMGWTMMADSTAHGQASLSYSCSAQVHKAFETERIPAFTEATGIDVNVYVCSSGTAVNRLMNDYSDIASTARRLAFPAREHGYTETVFCKDPLAVIVHSDCPVTNITDKQLQGVFSRDIYNWKQLGGPDRPILLVVPGKNTAAYANFERQVMTRSDIVYDLITYTSTQVIDIVNRVQSSISFIAQGAVANQVGVRTMKINGLGIKDGGYPYYQEFSFVTKGAPRGAAKAFIDFASSEKGIEIIKKLGMTPVLP